MGSVAAYRSLERVLFLHERELTEEAYEELPSVVRLLEPTIECSNEVHYILRVAWFTLPDGHVEGLELRQLHIDELAERYADAEVGY